MKRAAAELIICIFSSSELPHGGRGLEGLEGGEETRKVHLPLMNMQGGWFATDELMQTADRQLARRERETVYEKGGRRELLEKERRSQMRKILDEKDLR